MWHRIDDWLRSSKIASDMERQQAYLLQLFLLAMNFVAVLGLVVSLAAQFVLVSFILYGLLIVFTGLALWLLRRGSFVASVLLIALAIVGVLTVAMVLTGLTDHEYVAVSFLVPITLTGLLLRRTWMWAIIALIVAILVALFVAEQVAPGRVVGLMRQSASTADAAPGVLFTIGLLGLFLDRFGGSLRQALAAAHAREQELEQLRASLETTVVERTAALSSALQTVEQREAKLTATLDELHASQIALRELSAPVLPVIPGVLVAPLVGDVQSDRARVLTENVLSAVEAGNVRYVVFDVTAVPTIDTHVAQVLLQTAAAARLLGARVVLAGVRPDVAQTLVTLGVDLGGLTTYIDLQQAVLALLAQSTPSTKRSVKLN